MSSQNGQTSQRTGQQIAGVSEQVRAIEDLPVAIAAYAADYPAGHDTGTHAHTKAQLVHAEAGVMTVRGADGSWVVPTNFAVWIPAGVEHRVRAATAIRMRSLYVAASEDDLRYALGLFETYGKDTGRRPDEGDNKIRPIELFMCSVIRKMGYADGFRWLAQFF